MGQIFDPVINGILHPKVTILSPFTHPYVILNLFDFLLRNIKKKKVFFNVLEQHEDEKIMTDSFKRMSYYPHSFHFHSVKVIGFNIKVILFSTFQ